MCDVCHCGLSSISLKTDDTLSIFSWLLAIQTSSFFFLKYLFETLNHFSTVIFPFLTGLQKFFIYSWCKFCQLHALSISLTTLTCLLHSVGEVFWWIKVMYCNVVQVTYLFPVNLVHSVSCLRSTKATKTAYVMLYKCYYFTFHV